MAGDINVMNVNTRVKVQITGANGVILTKDFAIVRHGNALKDALEWLAPGFDLKNATTADIIARLAGKKNMHLNPNKMEIIFRE